MVLPRAARCSEGLCWFALGLVIVSFTLLTTTPARRAESLAFDGGRYVAMVERELAAPMTLELKAEALEVGDPQKFGEAERRALLAHLPPFCWRVLTPFIASLLPFEALLSMKIVGFLAGWGTLGLLGLLLRSHGLSRGAALVGVLLYAGSYWSIKFAAHRPSYIDPLTQTILVGGLLLVSQSRYLALLPLVGIGLLQKESLVLLVPVAALHWAVHRGWRTWSFAGYAASLVVLALVPRGVVVEQLPSLIPYSGPRAYLRNLGTQVFDPEFWPRLVMAFLAGLGVLGPLLLLRARAAWRVTAEEPHLVLVILLGLAMLWGGSDKSRIFLYSLPVLCLVAVWLLQPLFEEPDIWGGTWLALTLLLHLFIGHLVPEVWPRSRSPLLLPIHARIEDVLSHLLTAAGVAGGWIVLTLGLERIRGRRLTS